MGGPTTLYSSRPVDDGRFIRTFQKIKKLPMSDYPAYTELMRPAVCYHSCKNVTTTRMRWRWSQVPGVCVANMAWQICALHFTGVAQLVVACPSATSPSPRLCVSFASLTFRRTVHRLSNRTTDVEGHLSRCRTPFFIASTREASATRRISLFATVDQHNASFFGNSEHLNAITLPQTPEQISTAQDAREATGSTLARGSGTTGSICNDKHLRQRSAREYPHRV